MNFHIVYLKKSLLTVEYLNLTWLNMHNLFYLNHHSISVQPGWQLDVATLAIEQS